MFNIGDVVIYSAHGVSKIDNICEKTFSNVTKTYYEIHPLEQANSLISTPVDNDKVVMLKMMDRVEAEEILQSFQQTGICWVGNLRERNFQYKKVVKGGVRSEIAKVVNTLMRKDIELRMDKKNYMNKIAEF